VPEPTTLLRVPIFFLLLCLILISSVFLSSFSFLYRVSLYTVPSFSHFPPATTFYFRSSSSSCFVPFVETYFFISFHIPPHLLPPLPFLSPPSPPSLYSRKCAFSPPPPKGKHLSENIRRPTYRRYKVSSVGIGTVYWLNGRASIPCCGKNFFFPLHSAQTRSGTREADHSLHLVPR
jgi:hypothetical protein